MYKPIKNEQKLISITPANNAKDGNLPYTNISLPKDIK